MSVNDAVKGLSWGEYGEGTIVNINYSKWLLEHATHFVEQYEKNPTDITRRDTHYFVAMLKESPQKEALLKRIN